ncbi:MAG: hypothetical protein AAGI37_16260 [Planctomycetota bacterium]
MTDYMKLLLAPVLASAFLLTGCGGGDSHDDHDHDQDNHKEHAEHDGHGHEDGDEHGHGTESELGEIEIAGSVLHVSVGGEPGPNVTLHIDIEVESGPTPAAIRAWIGNESATGSVKGKAFGSDGDYHADITCPAELTEDAALWIEIESADGTRTVGSLPLVHHDE